MVRLLDLVQSLCLFDIRRRFLGLIFLQPTFLLILYRETRHYRLAVGSRRSFDLSGLQRIVRNTNRPSWGWRYWKWIPVVRYWFQYRFETVYQKYHYVPVHRNTDMKPYTEVLKRNLVKAGNIILMEVLPASLHSSDNINVITLGSQFLR